MRVLVVTTAALLAACQAAPTKQNPPPAAVITVPVATYVPIDAQLRKRCKWVKEAAPSAVFEVSNGRKRCLLSTRRSSTRSTKCKASLCRMPGVDQSAAGI